MVITLSCSVSGLPFQRTAIEMYQYNFRSHQKLVTNPSLISRKPTGIAARYFLYRYGTKCDHLRKGLKFNEGEDRRNHRKLVSSPEVLG